MNAAEMFEHHDDEYGKFELIRFKRSRRPDLHAFILLDMLFPGSTDVVSCAEHDQFWLFPDSDDIDCLSEESIIELIRCGVMYDEGSLTIFA